MGRYAVKNKNKIVSISLPHYQINFIENSLNFNLSKFVQVYLKNYIDKTKFMEECNG